MSARFQSFEDAAEPRQGTRRIPLLRAELRRRGLDGFVVPRSDEHQSEYVPPSADRLQWLTGFTGSAGTALILLDEAALVVDGRYTLQAENQVDTALLAVVPQAQTTAEAWIEAHLKAGGRLGYDPWLHTARGVEALEKAVAKAGGTLAAQDTNPLDAVWTERPDPPVGAVSLQPIELAGETADAKLARLAEALGRERLDALVISDPHNLSWLLNIRGRDVAHTPLVLGYALVPHAGRPSVFLEPAKVSNEVGDVLGRLAWTAPPAALAPALAELGRAGARVRIDNATGAAALGSILTEAGGTVDAGPDPLTLMKAVKNEREIAGARAAHLRDGAAVARFLHWLARESSAGRISEIKAVERLEDLRRETGSLRDVSFPTISGSGPNGAIVHYRVTRSSDRTLGSGELFLVDSGAQYPDGTTDITRTVAIGEPSAEMRDRFTRVLKGHIAIARAVFPRGTSGAQIDGFARRPLWEAGLDFDHGTGHGIGSFLSVHEGPQRISKLGSAALEPGMILSNEPGYYAAGRYGIRIENLLVVQPREIAGGERPMLGFETLTLAPIDRSLVEPALLDAGEIAWLDGYHARVEAELVHLVDADTAEWLRNVTRPLADRAG